MSLREVKHDTVHANTCIPIANESDSLSHRSVSSSKVPGLKSKQCSVAGASLDSYRVGNYSNSTIPGYTGYVPGIRPETCYGGSRGKLLDQTRHGMTYASLNGGGNRYSDVIGYTGYIPGKHSCNVFGQTFCRANQTATELNKLERKSVDPKKRDFVNRARRLLDDIKPSNVQGNYPMYAAQERSTVLKTRKN